MGNRSYAQINCSLTASKKIQALNSAEARWAYMAVHLADQSNYLGIFIYPRVVWAHDALVPLDEIDSIIADLVSVGLLEYDHDEEVVRIVGWFHKKNAPENGSRAIGVISDYQLSEFPSEPMLMRSIAEFAVGTIKRALNWDTDLDKFRVKLKPFLQQTLIDEGTGLLDAIIDEAEACSQSVISELNSLLPAIEQHRSDRVSTGCRDTTLDETRPKQDVNGNEDETKTSVFEVENIPLAYAESGNVELLGKG